MQEVQNMQEERDMKDKQCTGGARRAKGAGYAGLENALSFCRS